MKRSETQIKAVAIPMVDPVCGMNVPPGRIHLIASYRGHNFYFCANACRKAFELNPDLYLKSQSFKTNANRRRYLETLA